MPIPRLVHDQIVWCGQIWVVDISLHISSHFLEFFPYFWSIFYLALLVFWLAFGKSLAFFRPLDHLHCDPTWQSIDLNPTLAWAPLCWSLTRLFWSANLHCGWHIFCLDLSLVKLPWCCRPPQLTPYSIIDQSNPATTYAVVTIAANDNSILVSHLSILSGHNCCLWQLHSCQPPLLFLVSWWPLRWAPPQLAAPSLALSTLTDSNPYSVAVGVFRRWQPSPYGARLPVHFCLGQLLFSCRLLSGPSLPGQIRHPCPHRVHVLCA